MALIFKNGNLFSEPTEAIVNTVNCVGVMGKGVALEFKKRWPENFEQYRIACEEKRLKPGKMFVFENRDMFTENGPKFLINFPTKDHWRSKSKVEYISDGLDDFIDQLRNHQIKSVALPPLGCGNGGLEWKVVKPLIESKLSAVEGIDFIVLEPFYSNQKPEHEGPLTKMTFERAVLLKTACEFEKYFGGSLTRIVTQKLVYFLQALGVKYNLVFLRNQYGPYSDTLKKAFLAMEKQGLLTGYSSDDRKINISPSGYSQAEEFLANNGLSTSMDVIKRLDRLVNGYESPYGMELLSSVHFLTSEGNANSVKLVIEAMQDWTVQKGNNFSPEVIQAAYDRLESDGLIH
ncbi:type II toxin-antitoxin system antitoxin DNA ADP-ribosyl glycohydrolase DarG [Rhodovibrionaceae bacterium A322]